MKALRTGLAAACLTMLAGALIFACGDSSDDEGASPDSGFQTGDAAFDGTMSDAPFGNDSSTPGDASLDAGALPITFFGMTQIFQGAGHAPTVPYGGLRLWDTTAVWGLMHKGPGSYDFTALDVLLAEAADAGADVLFTFGRTPTWASADDASDGGCGYAPGSCYPPADVRTGDNTLKDFTTALVNHSLASTTAHIKYYEIWNEPDLGSTWAGLDAVDLATMGKDIYATVHALDPNAMVIGPAPSTGNQFGIHFLPAYYEAGGAPYQDIVGMHAYLYDGGSFATAPEGITTTISQLHTLMSANGVGGKSIIFTEGSWGGAPTNASMTMDEKVAYLARDYLYMWMNGISSFYWYAWDNSQWGTLSNGSILPTGTAYGIIESWLVGSTHDANNCTESAMSTWTCTLTLQDKTPAIIVWNGNATHSLTVPAGYTHYRTVDDATVHDVVGGAVSVGAKPILVSP